MINDTRHHLIVASVIGVAALAAALPASAQQTEVQKRNAAIGACQREADSAVPRLQTTQDEMNRYLVFAACAEKRGYHFGNGYGGWDGMNWWRG